MGDFYRSWSIFGRFFVDFIRFWVDFGSVFGHFLGSFWWSIFRRLYSILGKTLIRATEDTLDGGVLISSFAG